MKWFLIIPLAIIVGCGETQDNDPVRPIVISSEPIARPELNLPNVDQYTARNVNWIVITPENAVQIFSEMEARGQAPALFALDENGYENISVNTQEALRIILQQQAQIDGYREYYIIVNRRILTHNNSISE